MWRNFGDLSAARVLRLHLANTLIHTWDLAQATGFEFDPPASDALDVALGCMRNLPAQLRGGGKPFGDVVNLPAHSALDELLILSGRNPAGQPRPAWTSTTKPVKEIGEGAPVSA